MRRYLSHLRYVFRPEDVLGKSHKPLSINVFQAQGVDFESEMRALSRSERSKRVNKHDHNFHMPVRNWAGLRGTCSSSTSSARGLANNAGGQLTFRATRGRRQLTLTAPELTFRATSSQTAAQAQSSAHIADTPSAGVQPLPRSRPADLSQSMPFV
jgi:hypothetical protein